MSTNGWRNAIVSLFEHWYFAWVSRSDTQPATSGDMVSRSRKLPSYTGWHSFFDFLMPPKISSECPATIQKKKKSYFRCPKIYWFPFLGTVSLRTSHITSNFQQNVWSGFFPFQKFSKFDHLYGFKRFTALFLHIVLTIFIHTRMCEHYRGLETYCKPCVSLHRPWNINIF